MPGYVAPAGAAMPIANAAIGAVNNKFFDAYLKINQSYADTKEQFSALQESLTGLTPMELYPEYEDPEFIRFILATGEKPVAPTIDFPIMTIPDVDVPIPGFNYSDSPYASELKEALKVNLIDGVENGGTGLGADIEAGIFERDRLRREQARQDALDAASTMWADDEAGDLGLPDGALAASLTAIHTEHLQKEQTVSFDTATKMAELARAQQEVYLKVGTELENVMETKHSADQLRSLEAAKTEPEIIIRIFEAQMVKVKVMAEVYNALAAKANAQAVVFKTEMDGYLADVEVGSKELAASTQKYDSDVKGATARSEAYYKTDSNRIEQMKNYLNLRIEGMKSLAQLNASILSAFATSVSATASIGASGSGSASDTTSNSASYVETKDVSE